jgi:hypothetical protein
MYDVNISICPNDVLEQLDINDVIDFYGRRNVVDELTDNDIEYLVQPLVQELEEKFNNEQSRADIAVDRADRLQQEIIELQEQRRRYK